MAPAYECLDTSRLPTLSRHDRLIMHFELLFIERLAQADFNLGTLARFIVHARREDTVNTTPIAFRCIKRKIDCVHDLFFVAETRSIENESDAAARLDKLAINFIRLGKNVTDPRRQCFTGATTLVAALDDRELIATKSGNNILAASGAPKTPRDLDQHFIGNGMAIGIIHPLEVIEVDHKDIKAPVRSVVTKQTPDLLHEIHPVEQPRQTVMACEVKQLPFIALAPDDTDDDREYNQPRQERPALKIAVALNRPGLELSRAVARHDHGERKVGTRLGRREHRPLGIGHEKRSAIAGLRKDNVLRPESRRLFTQKLCIPARDRPKDIIVAEHGHAPEGAKID